MTSARSTAVARPTTLASQGRGLVLAFLVLISLPALVGLGSQDARDRERAGEPPVRPPSLTHAGGVGPYLREIQAYLRATFGLRQTLIHWDARLKRALGLSESYGSAVTHGRDGWLFYRVHRGRQGVRPELPFAPEELDRWVRTFTAQHRQAAELGIRYLFLVAPDKETIYPDLLPAGLPPPEPVSRLDVLAARLRAEGVPLVDLRPALREARGGSSPFSRWPLYHRTDDHWNELGALLAARPLLAELRARFPGVRVPLDDEVEVTTQATAGGDLARMEGVQEISSELQVRARVRSLACVFDPFGGPKPTGPEVPLQAAQVLECTGAPIRRGLILHDSMMVAMLPVLAPVFQRSVWRLTPVLDQGLLAAERPDVVVVELVERTLWEGLPGW